MAKTVFTITVDDQAIDSLAGGFCYDNSRFRIQEVDKIEFLRKVIERYINEKMNLYVDTEYKDRKINSKPSLPLITVRILMSSNIIFVVEVDDMAIDNLAGGFSYGKSRFGIQEPDKREFIRKYMERSCNKNMNLYVDFQFKDRKIDVKPDLPLITVTMKQEE